MMSLKEDLHLSDCAPARGHEPDFQALLHWSPAWSCELFCAGGPLGIDWHSELFCSGGSPGIDWHSQLFCPDGEPRGRLALGPVSLGLCPSATCPAPGALKLRSFLTPWSPALSCVSSSVQVGPLALTGIASGSCGTAGVGNEGYLEACSRHSTGVLPEPSDPPALSFQGVMAGRAKGAPCP
ncbi:uncharacterized protein LOC105719965 isoform X3 [Aotus nancymaae]|uniref:uncharacterized protein LOC105719965 isoform X3 n=1 Tax=Aotus nancymaae TaxID=37293 RepID=UPI0030FE3C04